MRIFFLCFLFPNLLWASKVSLPEDGGLFGAYIDAGPLAADVNLAHVQDFERHIGKKLAWIYFSNNWIDGEIRFPEENVIKCREIGRVPYIRLMPWSVMQDNAQGEDPLFTMEAFIRGDFDQDLKLWVEKAKTYPGPLILEFGPEVNGKWFPWNGFWNGAGNKTGYGDPEWPDGPEKFRDAYRHIVDLFRREGLAEVTWVLHLDTARLPHTWWNKVEYYYPGDSYIDWIGLSVFGAQLPNHDWVKFLSKFKNFWPQVKRIAENKPVIISEFAVIEDRHDSLRKAQWISRALRTIQSGLYPIKGASYWNSPGWLEDGSADFRVTSSTYALEAFVESLQASFWKNQDLEVQRDD